MDDLPKEYVARYGIPFEVQGTYLDGDRSLVVYGNLKDMKQLQMRNVSLGGRFQPCELTPITEEEAKILLSIALRDKMK